jgi:hypothetical protein
MTTFNSWNVSFSSIKFFEDILRGHSTVASVQRQRDILFHIERKEPLEPVTALLLDEYTLSIAAVLKALGEFPEAKCIVTGGNWNAYTREAKEYGDKNQIGIFVIGEFLGSLNLQEPYQYVRKDEKGHPTFQYRSA